MDHNLNPMTGMNLTGGTGQNASGSPAGATGHGAMNMPLESQQVIPVAPTAPVMDEALSDEEIDQVWVNKAKDIVEQTKTDPFTQSNEINKIKAEYLKIRFNKDLHINDKNPQ